MPEEFRKNIVYTREDFTLKPLPALEFDHCTFSGCVFLNIDLTDIKFNTCVFENCDLTMAILKQKSFVNARFFNCKLLGLRFDHCDTFTLSFQFEECVLSFASFYKLKLKNTKFVNCKLEEVEFIQTDLSNAIFDGCDLIRAAFENTILENADLRTASNFSINPEFNRIKNAKFSYGNISGLLDNFQISIS